MNNVGFSPAAMFLAPMAEWWRLIAQGLNAEV
jgi:hypothetical protein